MSNNSNLHRAKKAKNDEFFTQLSDIENELSHYKDHFKGKVVYCNCDDARESNFVIYFKMNFDKLGLKKLIATGYRKNGLGVKLVYDSEHKDANIELLEGDGDFRSEECVELLKQADIVATNCPFSLFREYVAQLVGYGKKFLILGNFNGVKFKEIFPLIKNNKLWLGCGQTSATWFQVPEDTENQFAKYVDGKKMVPVKACWYTNLNYNNRREFLTLTEKYDPAKYPKFDNYDAINVDKVNDIPKDYWGVMGVPITFLDKYNPEQFEIVGMLNAGNNPGYDFEKPVLNGRVIFTRLLIRRKDTGENAEAPAV